MGNLDKIFPDESVLLEQKGWWIKSFLNVKTGTIVLTDKRIAFVEEKMIVGGGLIAAGVDAALGVSRPKLKVDVPLEELKGWSQPRKVDILIETTGGQSFKLRGVEYPKWDAQLKALKEN